MTAHKTEPIKTVLTIVVGFLLVYFMVKHSWPLYVAVIVGVAGLASGRLAMLIDKAWLKLGWLLSLVIPNIILSLIFFLLLTPIAFLSKRGARKDTLKLKNPGNTVFVERNKIFTRDDFEKPW
jgi:hypothetical protein